MAFVPPPVESLVEEDLPVSKTPAFFNPPPADSIVPVEQDADASRFAIQEIPTLAKVGARMDSALEKTGLNIRRMVDSAADALHLPEVAEAFGDEGTYRRAVDQNLRYYNERENKIAQQDAAMDGGGFGMQAVEGLTRGVAELPLTLLPGAAAKKAADAVKIAAAASGAIQGLSTYGQERGDGKIFAEAAPYAITSGLITALTTKAFGATGVESVFRKEGVTGIGKKILSVLKNAGLEGAEESVDQFQQDFIERVARNPDKPIEQSFNDVLMAGTVGTLIGGMAAGVKTGLTPDSKPSDFEKMFDAAKDRTPGRRAVDAMTGLSGARVQTGVDDFGNPTFAPLVSAPNATAGDIANEAQSRQENESLVDSIMKQGEKKAPAFINPPEAKVETEFTLKWENGLPVGDLVSGLELVGDGSESTVYRRGNKVVKVSEPYNSNTEEDYQARINRAKLIDSLIGDGSLEVDGFYRSKNGTKNPIFTQDHVDGRPATREEIKAHMESRGFSVKESGSTTDSFSKGNIVVGDLDGANVIVTPDGKAHIIDADVTINQNTSSPSKESANAGAAIPESTSDQGAKIAETLGMTFSGEQKSLVPGQSPLWDFRFKEPGVQMFSVVVPAGTPEPDIIKARDAKIQQLREAGDWKETPSPETPKEPTSSAPAALNKATPPKEMEQGGAAVVVSSGKPNGAKVEVQYEIVEAASLKPQIVRDVSLDQTRQRTGNAASDEQIAKIATAPDISLLSESPTSTVGAPILDDVVIAGNGRVSGIIAGYEGGTKGSHDYRRGVVESAKRLGLGDVSGMVNPVLIRRVKRYVSGDKASFVVESNPKYAALKESTPEAALLDAQALGDIGALPFNESGSLTAAGVQQVARLLDAAQRNLTRAVGGDFDANEANKRVQLATLATLAKENNVSITDLIGLIESDDGRRVMGEVTRVAPRLQKLAEDLRLGGYVLKGMRELQSGIASVRDGHFTSLDEWYNERKNELLKSGLDTNSEGLLKVMVASQKKPTVLRELFNDYLKVAEYEQNQRNEAGQTADIFGESRKATTAEEIFARVFGQEQQDGGQPPSVGVKPIEPAARIVIQPTGEYPTSPDLPKSEAEVRPGKNIFSEFTARLDEWKAKVDEWLKSKPENKAIVWEEAEREMAGKKYKGNVRALTRNIGDPKNPWRVTSYGERNGAYMPMGHQVYPTRLAAMAEEAKGGIARFTDEIPGRVMDEQEIQGFKLMADIPDKSTLVWYKLKPGADISRLSDRLRTTVNMQKFVKDSAKDGRVAFTGPLEVGNQDLNGYLDYLGIEPEAKPVAPVAASTPPTVEAKPISESKGGVKNETPSQEEKGQGQPGLLAAGSLVHVKGMGARGFTVVEKLTATPVEIENGEQPFRVRDDQTGKEQVVLEGELKTYTPKTDAEREASKPKTLAQINAELRSYGLDPKDYPNKKAKLEAIKRAKAKGGDDAAANLGNGLPEGMGWDAAGIHEAVRGEDAAGFGYKVISRDDAVRITGKDEAAGYGGFFYKGKIYLVADNIARGNAENARQILREEVGHGLLRTPEGQALIIKALEEGKLQLTEAERQVLLKQGYLDENNQLLDEFVAKSARENRTWWQNIVDAVRAFLSKLGLKLSNEEVARLLLKQIRASYDSARVDELAMSGVPAASRAGGMSAEQIASVNRELNTLNEKQGKTAADNARIVELERQLGQEDLFSVETKPTEDAAKKKQRAEIERRQNRRLVAGQIQDQGGLFAEKKVASQDDMFSVPNPKTEMPPATKSRNPEAGLFGDLAPSGTENPEEIRSQFRGNPGVGRRRMVESVSETRAAIKEQVFNSTPAVTAERTDDAWRLANELTDEVLKAGNALRLKATIGGQDMALPLLKDEVVRYAMKLAASGNDSLLRFALDSKWQTITGGDESTAGSTLRAARELSDSPALRWITESMTRERQAAAAAGARIVPQETFLALARDMENLRLNPDELEAFLNRARTPDGRTLDDLLAEATSPAPESPRAPRAPREAGTPDTMLPGFETTDAERVARQILTRLENRHSDVEWLRPDSNINEVREIIKTALKGRLGYPETDATIDPILDDPTRIVEKIQAALENAGVEPETARALGREVETERKTRWTNLREGQMRRAAGSKSVRSLIESILSTPYRAQHDPEWRRGASIRWFESNGLSKEQAEAAATLFNDQFEAAMKVAADKVAKAALAEGRPRTDVQLERLLRAGVLDPSKHWVDLFAEQTGWKIPTKEQFAKLTELEEKIADPALSPSEVHAMMEQQMTILRHIGKRDGSGMRALAESFTASLLSSAVVGGRTFTVQLAPMVTMIRDFAVKAATDPKNALNFARAIKNSYINNLKNQVRFGWQKNAFQFHINEIEHSYNELQRVHEETSAVIASKTASLARKGIARLQQVYALQRLVFRLLNTLDNAQMSAGKEWKLVFYASRAFKEAGINSSQKVGELVDWMQSVRQSEYEKAIDAGLDDLTANVRADNLAAEAAYDFTLNNTNSNLADQAWKAAENDVYSVVGRRAPGIGESDEGFLSKPMNFIMAASSDARSKGGLASIGVTLAVGMINIPFRAARFASEFYGYGLVRYGIHRYRQNKGLDTYWKQSFATELQAKHRRNMALASLAVMAVALGNAMKNSTSDDDAGEEKFGVYVTGGGPKNKALRDEWIKAGWRPYSIHFVMNGVGIRKLTIPLTRVGEGIFPPFLGAAVVDTVKWRQKEARANGKEINVAKETAIQLIGAHFQLLQNRGIFQTVSQYQKLAEGGAGFEKNVARLAGSTVSAAVMPFKSAVSSVSEMILGPMDNSSAQAVLANQFPIVGLPWQHKAVNRFGDELNDRSWYGMVERLGYPISFQIAPTPENKRIYPALLQKGVGAPELRRYVLEEKYGQLTDDQFADFADKSGALLKQSVAKNISAIEKMTPEAAKDFVTNAAQQADRIAASALALKPIPKESNAPAPQPSAAAVPPATTKRATQPSAPATQSRAPSASSIKLPRSASGRVRTSLASYKVPKLKKLSGKIRSRMSSGFRKLRSRKSSRGRLRARMGLNKSWMRF